MLAFDSLARSSAAHPALVNSSLGFPAANDCCEAMRRCSETDFRNQDLHQLATAGSR